MTKPTMWLCAQRRLRSAPGCPGWSESSLGEHSFCWFCHVAAQMLKNAKNVSAKNVSFNIFRILVLTLFVFSTFSLHRASFIWSMRPSVWAFSATGQVLFLPFKKHITARTYAYVPNAKLHTRFQVPDTHIRRTPHFRVQDYISVRSSFFFPSFFLSFFFFFFFS